MGHKLRSFPRKRESKYRVRAGSPLSRGQTANEVASGAGMSEFLQFAFSGLTVGAIYALVALGFTIIYNASDVINFAQGEFVMLGGMVTVSPPPPACRCRSRRSCGRRRRRSSALMLY